VNNLVWEALFSQIEVITQVNQVLPPGKLKNKIKRQSGKGNGSKTERSEGREKSEGSISKQKL
jgi:hypothetical protein